MRDKRKKKGTAPRRQHPTNHQYYSRVEHICLCLLIAFLILFIGGCYLHHEPMKYIGLGIGLTIFMIQVDINLSEEDDDIWEE